MNQLQNTTNIEYPRYTQEDFQFQVPAYCDLVMKGGIASGVVYPLAICELAKKYQFKSIGGTSAGAIAAAAAAAAEYGRQHKQGSGFVGMSEVPSFLGKNLSGLFQATPNTEPLFQLFLKILSTESQQSRIIQLFTTIISHFKTWFIIGTLPGLIALILIIYNFVWPVGLF
jgi:predicted acylesterase/phospholipase RssA